ncbi:MAG: hypothetical protein ACRCTF_01545 [Bacteroidales bacterium]
MERLKEYISDILGFDIPILPLDIEIKNHLPLMITSLYSPFVSKVLERDICVLEYLGDIDMPIGQIEKHKMIIGQIIDMPIVFVFHKVASYNIKRYISKRLNFIIPQKQLFIPELLMDLRKATVADKQPVLELSPNAQFILFYHLQKESLNGLSIKQVAELLANSYLKVNRGINILKDLGICMLTGSKEKIITFNSDKRRVWDNALKFLINPIQKELFTDENLSYLRSNINALSHYTMLSDDSKEYYAVSKEELNRMDIAIDSKYGENSIEVWKYDPIPLSNGGYVDKLSLYASLKEEQDERVQIELKNLIDEIKW